MQNIAHINKLPLSISSTPMRKPVLLAVDDDRVMLMMLIQALEKAGYDVHGAAAGAQALALLHEKSDAIDAVILDQEMPGLSGLQVVEKMKADPALAMIPVIMLTGNGSPQKIREGIDAGLFYYMVKPASDELIRSVAASAVRERQQKRLLAAQMIRYDIALKAMASAQIHIRTLDEAENVAYLIASCFPSPERVVTGLMDLLINAVEHGNLGITYEEKAKLVDAGTWHDEIERRLALPENAQKLVDVSYQRRPDGWFVQITDQGKGFDWKRFWQIDPARATASHGRGIARARLISFDKMAYNESGNQVTAMIGATPLKPLEW